MNQIYYNYQRKAQGCEKLGITEGQWSYIKRISTTLGYLYANECNGFSDDAGNWDERANKRNEARIARWESYAIAFAKRNKLHIYLQTDPRGASIYLDKKPIPQNNYSRAICVY